MGEDAKHTAMVEFLCTFPTLSGAPPKSLRDLSDGVALFEAMSEMAPDRFDPTTIARHLGDNNWALKSSNLQKLVRNLGCYYHEDLKKDTEFADINSDLENIARTGDAAAIAGLVELVAAAAVTCELQGEFVERIMGMSQVGQVQMNGIIESGLQRLQDYDGEEEEGDDSELIFGDNMNTNNAGAAAGMPHEKGQDDDSAALFDTNVLRCDSGDVDKAELETHLMETRRELALQKSQLGELREDAEKAQLKLQAQVEDLQDRLASRQDKLITAEEELRTLTTELDDAKNKIHDLEEQKVQLQDDLDVATAKATQFDFCDDSGAGGEISEEGGGGPVRTSYLYDGKFFAVPKGYQFPKATLLDALRLWLNDQVVSVDGKAKVRPLRFIPASRLPATLQAQFRTNWLPIFTYLDPVLTKVARNMVVTEQVIQDTYVECIVFLKERVSYVWKGRRNPKEYTVSTWSNKTSYAAITKHGTAEDKLHLKAPTNRNVSKGGGSTVLMKRKRQLKSNVKHPKRQERLIRKRQQQTITGAFNGGDDDERKKEEAEVTVGTSSCGHGNSGAG